MFNDLRFALRMLRKNPEFGMAVVRATKSCETITDYEEGK